MMEDFTRFDINIYSLSDKVYTYEYHLQDAFFHLFDNKLVERGDLRVAVVLDKQPTLITANFRINGTVQLECDRSLEPFDHPLAIEKMIIYQYGEAEEEVSEDIYTITTGTQHINIAHLLYEFIGLALPMKRLHPSLAKEEDPWVEGEIIFSSAAEKANQENSEEEVDPRWQILRNLKNQ
ncbi:YceD family protein [Tunicatimonas pelagia]|uniref:YceD family protein n=1 Tax=Tunicatimonas pelagia TaxID=931531 RepID=UPI002664F383|nr:DUF177 domain-containing protein [Tunicatimonas pelagia]WKN46288.1 DUF177 domain-containing protein [Tunicatimonas pelagia]